MFVLLPRRLCHPKLVQLYGVCLQQHPLLIVAEFMENGCLLNFLRQRGGTLKEAWLLSMCQDVCEGMEYLEAHNFIHRDLVRPQLCVVSAMISISVCKGKVNPSVYLENISVKIS